jgi:hypothetical protein
MKSPPTRFS